ncbi:hypothetical protein [Verrucomicrobium spinosum]|uniref:hypothetical protein n=1 Tax=Verrucomicrobium spinosum TaxID=2736 RepID=UPI00017446BD|nr:hypothetical protein [Verrucomicrobium spinosum]
MVVAKTRTEHEAARRLYETDLEQMQRLLNLAAHGGAEAEEISKELEKALGGKGT